MTTKIQRTQHKNAIVKLVKAKKMILLCDIASVMNSKNIPNTVATLVKEGKLKRQKIQVRGLVGNLTNQWLVYDLNVKQNDILDFERQTVNKYFQSPLVENHCYKSPENPIEQKLKTGNAILDYFDEGRTEKAKVVEVVEVKELPVITNEVIPIYNNNNERMVNARELHSFLGIGKDFTSWIKDRIIKYDFSENRDYILTLTKTGERKNVTKHNYYLNINTAKEIAMVENNERGKYIRKYFIQIENEYRQQNNLQPTSGINALKMIVAELESQNNRITSLEGTIESMKKAITG